MSVRIWPLTVNVPAGTLRTAPFTAPWITEDNDIVSIEVLIPPGHNGQTGIRILKADVQVLPYGAAGWIIGNDYNRVFPFDTYMPTSDMKVQAFNEGTYSHNFYLRMTVSTHVASSQVPMTTESAALSFEGVLESGLTLSPDALLGSDVVEMLHNGDVTAEDLAVNIVMT